MSRIYLGCGFIVWSCVFSLIVCPGSAGGGWSGGGVGPCGDSPCVHWFFF